MPARRVISALVVGILVLSAVLLALYAVGQRACPPPEWAFWRFSEGANGAQNWACVAE